MINPTTLALEKEWKKTEKNKAALEKVYDSGKKKGDAGTLNPDKLDSKLLEQLPAPNGGTATDRNRPWLCIESRTTSLRRRKIF